MYQESILIEFGRDNTRRRKPVAEESDSVIPPKKDIAERAHGL